MDVQEHIRDLSDGFQYRDADGDVGDKHAVHHVHMDIIGIGDAVDIPLQICKIGGEDRRGNFNHGDDLFSVVFRRKNRTAETGSVTDPAWGA